MIHKRKLILSLIIILFNQQFELNAQVSKQNFEILRLIRHEKFDLILPDAMRDNNIDMWIHVAKDGDPDPLDLDLGGNIDFTVTDTLGYYIFTDRGGDRIERALFGGSAERGLYDIFDTESKLRKFVEERDPKVIAVNMSKWLHAADGLSYMSYLRLTKVLGKKYTKRLISSENVVTDFRVRRVQSEIIAFANACEIQRQIQEEAIGRIQPGITKREDIGWWAEDQLILSAMVPRFGQNGRGPSVLYSEAKNLTKPKGTFGETTAGFSSETRKPDYIYQRGDFLSWDWGVRYLNFGTDYKRNAYILKEGETKPPAGLQHAFNRGLEARKIIRKHIKAGIPGHEVLEAIVIAMEKEGYVYTPYSDIGSIDKEIINALGENKKSGFSIDCHPLGNTGNGDTEPGARLAPFSIHRQKFTIQSNHLFAFEYMVHTWIPEWGKRISINFEDNHIVTNNGVEWLYPPNEKIIIIP